MVWNWNPWNAHGFEGRSPGEEMGKWKPITPDPDRVACLICELSYKAQANHTHLDDQYNTAAFLASDVTPEQTWAGRWPPHLW